MEIKIEPNRLASLSKRMLEHQNRAKNLQHSLERETGKASSILSRSEFPPPFSGQISATNGSIKETSRTIVQTLEYQAAWLSYFAHKASGADNVPLSLTQATAILAKYDDRFRDPGKTDGIDAGKLAKDAAGELTGVYDAQRAATGIDPATGEKISGWSRVMAGGMFALGFTPIGKGIKAFKVVRTADKVIGVAKEGQAARRVVGSADAIKGAEESASYYRVQGGEMPNASQFRIQVDENGKMVIPNKEANLNVSAGTREHAEYFLHKRGKGSEIVEVEVPKWFDDFVNESAIPQYKYKSNPLNQGGTAPKVVDPNTPGTSYEFPSPWIEWLEEYGKLKK
ncbi:pre-toxin TG domain-containing protein [Fictibacillus enclensis]|uniref:pre-toxin TG domain-containing protein n=1 Tax=Fictibacillus enclensis TaxID=1017270 RepID=UPI0025A022FE|nr:pre-toxin TG domain-containing protein [Fictibacillus enclensis]MDM5340499.1 pre-toxin TG domain-containing protein [Fictibacillus enclensis]